MIQAFSSRKMAGAGITGQERQRGGTYFPVHRGVRGHLIAASDFLGSYTTFGGQAGHSTAQRLSFPIDENGN